MTDMEYKSVVQMFMSKLASRKPALINVLREEFEQNLNNIDFERAASIVLNDYAYVETNVNLDGKRIAVVCKGDPEITLQVWLASLRNNIHTKLVTLNYHIINTFLFGIYDFIMHQLRVLNIYLNYDENFYERDIMARAKNYDKVIFIGNRFDYDNFEYHCDTDNLIFWNDNNIKVFMNRVEHKDEYKQIVKFAYSSNIELEVYENEEEFFEEVQEGDCVIVYTDEENKERFEKNLLKARIICFNEFDIEKFKFKINDLLLTLDFLNKM